MFHSRHTCHPVRALFAAYTLPALLSACTPTPYELAYSAGVAAASRDDDTVSLREPQADLGLELAISRAWLDVSKTRFAHLDADADAGKVRLWGEVQNAVDYIEALRLVWSVPRVTDMHSDVEITNGQVRNLELARAIIIRLSDDPAVQVADFMVEVIDDSVYLFGRAQTLAELNRVIRHARAAGNVRRIVTLVQIARSDA